MCSHSGGEWRSWGQDRDWGRGRDWGKGFNNNVERSKDHILLYFSIICAYSHANLLIHYLFSSTFFFFFTITSPSLLFASINFWI